MGFFERMHRHEARRAFQEIARVQEIIAAHHPLFPEEAVWEALERTPAPPLPGVIHTWLYSPIRPRRRPYGMTFTIESRFLGVDAHRAYYPIVLPSGRVALGVPPDFSREVSSLLNRFATERLFGECGWNFPADLAHPEAFTALTDMLTSGGYHWRWNPAPPAESPGSASGSLLLTDPSSPEPTASLRWAPRRLWLEWAM
jgi:hypothetical protein